MGKRLVNLSVVGRMIKVISYGDTYSNKMVLHSWLLKSAKGKFGHVHL